MNRKKLNIMIPQWQGGGQDLCTYYGAYALRDNYLTNAEVTDCSVSTEDISPVKNDILGYDDILSQIGDVNRILREKDPDRIFTIGGGCDADIPCAAYLNQKVGGDMAMVYIDAHGDLNLPETSDSKLFYGMSLRTLAGDGDSQIIESLGSTLRPDQLFMGAGRALDPEEVRFQKEHGVPAYTAEELEVTPGLIADSIASAGYRAAYVHIDLDSLDPKEFTLTPVPEEGGLKCDTLIEIVRQIQTVCEIKGFAIMEYAGTETDRDNALIRELTAIGLEI